MNDQMGAQPVIILPEKTSRLLGKTAQKMNIAVAKAVAEAVRSTLGPKGMDKMLVDELGDVTITNDGATILKEMHIEHPVGKMMVEVAKTQDEETGDGTTSAVVMAGELLRRAEDLLDQNIHPSTLINGYKLASEKAQEELPKIAEPVDIKDTKSLLEVAKTTMASKGTTGTSKEKLAQIVVDAIQRVAEKVDGGWVINEDYIKIEKKQGGSLDDSELINGIVIDKERVHSGMPKKVENAKIALLDCALEIEKTETDARINISSPEQLQQFLDQEEKILEGMVERIAKTGANVVFCQKGIDDLAQHYLAKKGIYAVRRVKKSDLDKLARAT
ncbi:MAG: thermosome subunit beta, partial [archaeon]